MHNVAESESNRLAVTRGPGWQPGSIRAMVAVGTLKLGGTVADSYTVTSNERLDHDKPTRDKGSNRYPGA